MSTTNSRNVTLSGREVRIVFRALANGLSKREAAIAVGIKREDLVDYLYRQGQKYSPLNKNLGN